MDHLKTIDWKYLLLSFDGRIARRPYWIGVAAIFAATLVLSLVGGLLATISEPLASVTALACLVLIYPGAALSAKRWHDRGKSGWWSLVNLVPLGCFYALYELGFCAGAEEDNSYGTNPLAVAA